MIDRGGRGGGGRFVSATLAAALLACGGARGSDLLQNPSESDAGDASTGDASPRDAAPDAGPDALAPPGCSDAASDGSCIACTAAADCPATGSECVVATCVANACGTAHLDASHALSTGQTAGDCQKKVCDGMGGTTSIADEGDTPAAAGTCRVGTCVNGVPSSENAADGATCDDGNACSQTDVCQGGACVGGSPVACPAVDSCHATGTCSPTAGCSSPSLPDGTSCDDGNACTAHDVCSGGVCAGNGCASGVCGDSVSAFSGAPTPRWSFSGNATYDTTRNTVVLVDATDLDAVGTVIYDDPVAADAFEVSFDFRMTDTGNGRADGMMFIIETDGSAVTGGDGGGLGALGLTGYGVELDIYDNGTCSDSDDNHAGVDVLTPICLTNVGLVESIAVSADLSEGSEGEGVGDIGDSQWRTAAVTLTGGRMSVAISAPTSDGPIALPNLQGVALPGFVSGTPYYFGFSGATGGFASRHEVRNVQITFGTNRCL